MVAGHVRVRIGPLLENAGRRDAPVQYRVVSSVSQAGDTSTAQASKRLSSPLKIASPSPIITEPSSCEMQVFFNRNGEIESDYQIIPGWPEEQNYLRVDWFDEDSSDLLDLTGDGKPDVLLANGFHGLRLYKNIRTATPKVVLPKYTDWQAIGTFRAGNPDKPVTAENFKTPFQVIAHAVIIARPGDPIPSGSIGFAVRPTVGLKILD